MALTHSNKLNKAADKIEIVSNVSELNTTHKNSDENLKEEENWQEEDAESEQHFTDDSSASFEQNQDCAQEEYDGQYEEESNARDFSQNQLSLTFSWSLMNQLRYLARSEGINVEDLLIELVSEGVTKRAFEDQKPVPSHLMTRNGYVHNDSHSGQHPQPQMSHHTMNNRTQNGQTNRNKPGIQPRNGQYNNTSRYQNSQNRNYQGSNNRAQQQGNAVAFRQNNNSYNSQQRYSPRNNTNTNYSSVQQGNQAQRSSNDNSEDNQSGQTIKNKKY